ncbi:DHA2 family efflux MFS transporter permease subunit [Mesorhizobium sp. BAC0120]|uniref:DHA2 family efflux MFS transporter permease subunit n=1 Tax=Mesorhizobium sp. BAC0120 TaxID=3090670 RepID=UPI00298C5C32|nr:DHA2 family efflux MFS transporter permease subunit [Mesorhizobium sp. BAC0120]MDW6024766.1 DHA2 family efflux MFS transporter permease subunit [Mesorhizobium sp. BAC0120]
MSMSATAGSSPAARAASLTLAPIVALAAFMEVLDLSIANVALQHIAGELGASPDEATWILTSYLATNAIVLPISGWLATVLGRKRYYIGCIAGFGASSLLCGIAPTLAMLVASRALQGLIGGGLQPVSQAILADSFPPAQRGMAFAFYGMAVVVAPAVGPTIGGWITDNIDWRWVFLINVPISIALSLLVGRLIEDPPHLVAERLRMRNGGVRVDYIGFALLALGFGCLQVVLDRGQQDDWFASHLISFMALFSVAGLVSFVVWELRIGHPIVDLRLLGNRNFAVANTLMFMLGFVLLGSTALLPQFTQELLGYTAMEAGLVISPGGFALILIMPLVGRLSGMVDARLMIGFGLVVAAWALYRMSSFDLDVDYWSIADARLIQSIGLGFLFIPISTLAYVDLPPEKSNSASALINVSRNIGGSVGISFLTTMLQRSQQAHQTTLVAHVTPGNPAYRQMIAGLQQHFMAAGSSGPHALQLAQAEIANMIARQALVLSFLDNFLLLAVVFAALVPFVFLMRSGGAGPRSPMH